MNLAARLSLSILDPGVLLAEPWLCVCRGMFVLLGTGGSGAGMGPVRLSPVGLGLQLSGGVGGLCFDAQGTKSCLSVQTSWTSCKNTRSPLNRTQCRSEEHTSELQSQR